jgi:hypothetical protein
MANNPYLGTDNEAYWQQGYDDGFTDSEGEHNPPLDGDALQIFREGELAGREDAEQIPQGGLPPDGWEEIHELLEGVETINTLVEARELLAFALENPAVPMAAEVSSVAISPFTGILAVAGMMVMVWHALELPKRTIEYQGYSYALIRACCDMPDPTPNPGWPGDGAVNDDYSGFYEAVEKAKDDLRNQLFRNRLLLAIARQGPEKMLRQVWQTIIPEQDHLLRMYNPGWPNVSPA